MHLYIRGYICTSKCLGYSISYNWLCNFIKRQIFKYCGQIKRRNGLEKTILERTATGDVAEASHDNYGTDVFGTATSDGGIAGERYRYCRKS